MTVAITDEQLVLSAAHMLPSEVLKKVNYPEIAEFSSEISAVLLYTQTVQAALSSYVSGSANKIDINSGDLLNGIDLARSLVAALGRSDKVCFELLANLRRCLRCMQDVKYLADKYGDKYVGKPTETAGTV